MENTNPNTKIFSSVITGSVRRSIVSEDEDFSEEEETVEGEDFGDDEEDEDEEDLE
jgi:hypothetical protein